MIKELKVKKAGERLDKYIASNTDIPRNKVEKLLTENAIKINSKIITKKNTKLNLNDFIEIIYDENCQDEELKKENIPLNIVYEDEDIIVINKPKNMVVHKGAGNTNSTLVNALLYHTPNISKLCGEDRPGIVHRLDKDTTGLIVVAKSDLAYENLSTQLKDRTVKKIYFALVHGGFSKEIGIIDSPIGRNKKNRLKQAVCLDGRPAITEYEVIKKLEKYSLVKVKIKTGRTHQIRVHLKSINNPIVGDELYGTKSDKYKKYGQFLHAKTLGFTHPRTGKYIEFDSKLPEYFDKVLKEIESRIK